ncbi:2-hydroxyacid dehydrogenase [Eleftheria terrae]|uniref:2-hydroxyacid dehydrogenase n=1 Tax=Eleftheria terrae TaxID=1597781 RepID=UPI00263B8F57|nr:glyoxylate/hydroxypyruvate reductase A [Eleftheria terrae]WKB50969.1 glyoxylate/hydroxypyruvate reductase A [Eleftheria terrae]
MSLLLAASFDNAERARWLAELQGHLPGEQWCVWHPGLAAGEREEVEVAIVANPPPGSLAGLPRLRLVQSLWAGVDRLLRDPGLPAGVPLARMVDPAMNEAMAETALWAVLSLQRGFYDYARQQRQAQWLQHGQRRADQVAVLVLGLGEMGRTVALRLLANGYRVTAWSRRPARLDGVLTCSGPEGLQAALPEADIVINLLPLTPHTEGLFDARTFTRMREGSSLVNLARGGHVVEADLLVALEEGRLRHAVLDVFREEPLPAGNLLWSHPRVTVLPHVAAQTDPTTAAAVVAANVRALRAGQPLHHLVDRLAGY